MSEKSAPPVSTPAPSQGSCLRTLALGLLVVFFLLLAAGAFLVVSSLYLAQEGVVEPVSSLVRGLVIPATPVILPDRVTIVHEINQLARLETASYELEKIVRAERNNELLWGAFGESLIFVAYGEVIAGVDLTRLTIDDMQVVDPTTVMLHLPPAEVLTVDLDNERSYVADRDTGLLTRADPELETLVRQTAEIEIEQAALERGILQAADQNAQAYLESFLKALKFETVIFTDAPPPVPPPYNSEPPKGFSTPTPSP